jgi:hypothetical protein
MGTVFITLWVLGIIMGIGMTILGWVAADKHLCQMGVMMTLASLVFGYILFPIMVGSIIMIAADHAYNQRFRDQNNDD